MVMVKDVMRVLEEVAPLQYQEAYDNAGLICGHNETEVKGIVVSVDCTEAVIDDAIEKGANMVVCHHPIVFSGLKKITGKNYVERTIIKAIKNDVAIYAIHTNLDNVLQQGTNEQLANIIGLENQQILRPNHTHTQVELFASSLLLPEVKQATVKLQEQSGMRFEVVIRDSSHGLLINCPPHLEAAVVKIARHYKLRYQKSEVRVDESNIGAGLIGSLALPMNEIEFLEMLKSKLNLSCIRHTALLGKSVQKVAICGGSGSFLLKDAIKQGADFFVSGDFKYHEFFDAEDQIVIADVGHFESERFTMDVLKHLLNEKFSKFAAHYVEVDTNPINYFT